jgi:antitoxin (DNA-binding transcriptional repressor) of toxin-antitoxin stability system
MEATKITATELARNLSDVLNRVRYKGEHFKVMKGGKVVAELGPPPKTMTLAQFADFWERVPKPDAEYWDDVEAGIRLMNIPPETPPWES